MKVEFVQGDITKLNADAVVNAANRSLLGGGGVDGALHRAAGPGLLEECRKFGGCETGEAVITGAYNMPCKKIIHTPGPVWRGGSCGEDGLLRACYLNSLRLAAENCLRTVAFPAISTGVYAFPMERAAKIALSAVKNWDRPLPEKVIFVLFSADALDIYRKVSGRDA